MNVTLIYGDGIGYEVMSVAKEVIDTVTNKIQWDIQEAGAEIISKHGTPLPEKTLDSIRNNKIALKGPTATPVGNGFSSVNVEIRKRLDLYANVRPLKSFEGVDCLFKDIDLVIVRENTEGLYAGIEEMVDAETAITKKVITKQATERIAKFAYEYAKNNQRKKVTIAHKANIMKLTDGLFLDVAKQVGKSFDDIKTEDRIIDALMMALVMKPHDFDVIVAPNFYGDLLSDLGAGLVGGLGYAPGANIGEHCAVFEAVHGTAPDIAGKGIANPSSAILSGAMMLNYMGFLEEQKVIEEALKEVFLLEKHMYMNGSHMNTNKFKEEIIKKIKKMS